MSARSKKTGRSATPSGSGTRKTSASTTPVAPQPTPEALPAKAQAVRLLDLGRHLAIWKAPVEILRDARKNARSMDNRLLGLLTETIAKDQRLESLPLTTWSRTAGGNEELLIISGHHRIRAARAAGIKEIHILVDERQLTH